MLSPYHLSLVALIAILPLTACGSGNGAAPSMPEAYSERLTQAWQAAGEGQSPTQSCAIVTGLAVGRHQQGAGETQDALRAYELCYVDIPARYIQSRLASGDREQACLASQTFLITQQISLGSFAGDLGIERSALDGKLRERIAATVRSACPNNADSILSTD